MAKVKTTLPADYVVTAHAEDDRFVLVTPSAHCNFLHHDGLYVSFLVEAGLLGEWKRRMLMKGRTVSLV